MNTATVENTLTKTTVETEFEGFLHTIADREVGTTLYIPNDICWSEYDQEQYAKLMNNQKISVPLSLGYSLHLLFDNKFLIQQLNLDHRDVNFHNDRMKVMHGISLLYPLYASFLTQLKAKGIAVTINKRHVPLEFGGIAFVITFDKLNAKAENTPPTICIAPLVSDSMVGSSKTKALLLPA